MSQCCLIRAPGSQNRLWSNSAGQGLLPASDGTWRRNGQRPEGQAGPARRAVVGGQKELSEAEQMSQSQRRKKMLQSVPNCSSWLPQGQAFRPPVSLVYLSPEKHRFYRWMLLALSSANIYFLVALDLTPGSQAHRHAAKLHRDGSVRAATGQACWRPYTALEQQEPQGQRFFSPQTQPGPLSPQQTPSVLWRPHTSPPRTPHPHCV